MAYSVYQKESVSVGDITSAAELENIYDTLVIIEFEKKDDKKGVVRYVGSADTEEAREWCRKKGIIVSFVYHDSSEEDEECNE